MKQQIAKISKCLIQKQLVQYLSSKARKGWATTLLRLGQKTRYLPSQGQKR